MSFKRKFISAAASALAAVALTTFVSAQDANTNKEENNSTQKQEMRDRRGFGKRGGSREMRGGRHGGDKMMMRSLAQLNLSDAQKEQVRGISETFRTSTQNQREELRNLGMKKRDGIITAEEQARFQEIKTQLKASSEQMRSSILAVLTTEQKTRLEQMKEQMKQRRMERRQNRQPQTLPSEVN